MGQKEIIDLLRRSGWVTKELISDRLRTKRHIINRQVKQLKKYGFIQCFQVFRTHYIRIMPREVKKMEVIKDERDVKIEGEHIIVTRVIAEKFEKGEYLSRCNQVVSGIEQLEGQLKEANMILGTFGKFQEEVEVELTKKRDEDIASAKANEAVKGEAKIVKGEAKIEPAN